MVYESTYLAHHGVPGMKWGIRRYQNPDGSLTDRGKKHYESRGTSQDQIRQDYLRSKRPDQLTTKELNELNARQNAINQHKNLNPGAAKKFLKTVAAGAAAMGTIALFANNFNQLTAPNGAMANMMKNGKALVSKMTTSMRDLSSGGSYDLSDW